jgi:cytochrome c biogenesis protein CcmG, thiol:disulfide interchange protein DsbE
MSTFRRLGHVSAILLLASLASTLGYGVARAAPTMDQPAPALVVTELDGQTFDLSKFRGRVVLVNYWATWCAPCRKDMPTLDAFYRRYHDQGLEMIGISIDFPSELRKVRKTAASIAYPAAMLNEITVNGFGPPEGAPLTYVVDANGVVRDKFIATPNKLLMDVVVPLLPH